MLTPNVSQRAQYRNSQGWQKQQCCKNSNACIITLFKTFCHKIKPVWISPFHHTNSAWTKLALLLSTWGVCITHWNHAEEKRLDVSGQRRWLTEAYGWCVPATGVATLDGRGGGQLETGLTGIGCCVTRVGATDRHQVAIYDVIRGATEHTWPSP